MFNSVPAGADGAPFRAIRTIWHQNSSILGDPAELHKALDTPIFARLREKIPLPAPYFALTLLHDLNLGSVYAIDALLSGVVDQPTIDVQRYADALVALPAGREHAGQFHALVTELVSICFEPDLHSPVIEDKIHEGRGRIDIVFSNAAERGYFADLPFRHNIKCPVIFFECKNYSDDIARPEFAQLTSRFSEKRGKVGFIVCRKIENKALVQKRCRDRFQDNQEHVVVLEDEDLWWTPLSRPENGFY